MKLKLSFVALFLVNHISSELALICPNTSTNGETKPLYVLTLLSLPGALAVLSGHRIARDEINNRTDLLPGYHIELIVDTVEGCSSPEAGLGLSNLLKYTLNPPCRPVVAVAGLGCSSHTSVLSPVAGGDGFDLIQLSSANSPIFETQNNRFRHLWRFLGSAIVYSDTVLAIMNQYNWTRIGIVYNIKSVFHTEIAKHLRQNIEESTSKTVTFTFGLSSTRNIFLDTIISNIINTDTTILVTLLNTPQSEALLMHALKQGLVYPKYTWIHIEKLQSFFRRSRVKEVIYNATRGHIYLFTQSQVEQEQPMLVSGETLASFKHKQDKDIEVLKQIYSSDWPGVGRLNPSSFARYWYDQIWGLALALNRSLPVLENRSLSIDNYTIGQNDITTVIEEQMANLSFQGAGGWVEFNQYRGVSTPVEVYWILNGGKQERVGIYNPLKPSDFHILVDAGNLPNDTLYRTFELILVPLPVTILMLILAGAVIIFITIQFLLYLYYREHKIIKATSPYLSLLMFVGSYLLCLSAVMSIILISFKSSPTSVIATICLVYFLSMNGINLVLITLLVKLLRVKHIFNYSLKLRSHLGKHWSNASLVAFTVSFTVLVNVIMVPTLVLETPQYENYTLNPNDIVVQVRRRFPARENFINIGIVVGYIIVFLLVISFLAFRTRKIEYSNFKDTKKINLFVALLICVNCLAAAVLGILSPTPFEEGRIVVVTLWVLSIPLLNQLILFTPKLFPVMCEKLR